MKPHDAGEKPGLVGQAQDNSAERDLPAARRTWRSQRVSVPGELAWAISLMNQVGRTETDIAETLRTLAGVGGNDARAQRLKLAEEADKGAHDAAGHAARLHRQAGQWAEHEDVVALLQSLHHTGTVLTDLARAEKDLAATFTNVASRADPDRAAHLRHLADDALAGARRAKDRASSLRELAVSVLRRHHPPTGGA